MSHVEDPLIDLKNFVENGTTCIGIPDPDPDPKSAKSDETAKQLRRKEDTSQTNTRDRGSSSCR